MSEKTTSSYDAKFDFHNEYQKAKNANKNLDASFEVKMRAELEKAKKQFGEKSPEFTQFQRTIVAFAKNYDASKKNLEKAFEVMREKSREAVSKEVERLSSDTKLLDNKWDLTLAAGRKINLKTQINMNFGDIRVNISDPAEIEKMRNKKFQFNAMSIFETTALMGEDILSSVKDIALLLTSIPGSAIVLLDYIEFRKNPTAQNRAKMNLLLNEFPALALVDVLTSSKAIEMIKQLAHEVTSGTQWGVALAVGGIIGILASGGTSLASKSGLVNRLAKVGNKLQKTKTKATIKSRNALDTATAKIQDNLAPKTALAGNVPNKTPANFTNTAKITDIDSIKKPRRFKNISDAEYTQMVRKNANLSDTDRLAAAEKLLGKTLNDKQRAAILKAHNTGESGAWKWTNAELTQKYKIMEAGGLTRAESRLLLENGLTGKLSDDIISKSPSKVMKYKLSVDEIVKKQVQIEEFFKTERIWSIDDFNNKFETLQNREKILRLRDLKKDPGNIDIKWDLLQVQKALKEFEEINASIKSIELYQIYKLNQFTLSPRVRTFFKKNSITSWNDFNNKFETLQKREKILRLRDLKKDPGNIDIKWDLLQVQKALKEFEEINKDYLEVQKRKPVDVTKPDPNGTTNNPKPTGKLNETSNPDGIKDNLKPVGDPEGTLLPIPVNLPPKNIPNGTTSKPKNAGWDVPADNRITKESLQDYLKAQKEKPIFTPADGKVIHPRAPMVGKKQWKSVDTPEGTLDPNGTKDNPNPTGKPNEKPDPIPSNVPRQSAPTIWGRIKKYPKSTAFGLAAASLLAYMAFSWEDEPEQTLNISANPNVSSETQNTPNSPATATIATPEATATTAATEEMRQAAIAAWYPDPKNYSTPEEYLQSCLGVHYKKDSPINMSRDIRGKIADENYRQNVSKRFQQTDSWKQMVAIAEQNWDHPACLMVIQQIKDVNDNPTADNVRVLQAMIGMDHDDGPSAQDGMLGKHTIKRLKLFLEQLGVDVNAYNYTPVENSASTPEQQSSEASTNTQPSNNISLPNTVTTATTATTPINNLPSSDIVVTTTAQENENSSQTSTPIVEQSTAEGQPTIAEFQAAVDEYNKTPDLSEAQVSSWKSEGWNGNWKTSSDYTPHEY